MSSRTIDALRPAPWRGRAAWAAAAALALVLAACGGGGGGGSEGPGVNPGSQPPGSVGELSLVAGGLGGPGHADGIGGQARFDTPSGLLVDADGNLYVSDTGNGVIRKVTPAAGVSTLAGRPGEFSLLDGQGGAARFSAPADMAWEPSGALLVRDGGSIRRVTTSGATTTAATHLGFMGWGAIAADGAGRVYGVVRDVNCAAAIPFLMPCSVGDHIETASLSIPAPAPLGEAAGLPAPAAGKLMAVAGDGKGRVVAVRLSAADGLMDFFELNPSGGFDAVAMPESARRLPDFKNSCEGCRPANLTWTLSVAWEGDEGFRVALNQGSVVGHIATTVTRFFRSGAAPVQLISTRFSSEDGPFAQAGFRGVAAIAVDAGHRAFLPDAGNHTVRLVGAQGEVQTWAGAAPDTAVQDRIQAAESINKPSVIPWCDVTVGGNGVDVYAGFCQSLSWPSSPRFDSTTPRHVVRFTGAGAEPVKLGAADDVRSPFGVDAGGDIYADGRRYSPRGELKADFNNAGDGFLPRMAAVTPQGGVWWATPDRLRYLAPGAAAPVERARAGTGSPAAVSWIKAVATGASGDAYLIDALGADPDAALQVRKVTPDGELRTLAGRLDAVGSQDGPAASATFRDAQGLAVDRRGNVYVADTGNHTVRKITPQGQVSTLAGVPGKPGLTLGALPGRLNSPTSVAVDANDTLYIATPGAILKMKLPQ